MLAHTVVSLLASDMRAAYVERYAANLTAVEVGTLPLPATGVLGIPQTLWIRLQHFYRLIDTIIDAIASLI